MEKTKLFLRTPSGGFAVDVIAGTDFEEDVLGLLDKYVDRIYASEFY